MLGGCSNASSNLIPIVQEEKSEVLHPVVTSCPMYRKKNLDTNEKLVSEYGRLHYLWEVCYKQHENVKKYFEKMDGAKNE